MRYTLQLEVTFRDSNLGDFASEMVSSSSSGGYIVATPSSLVPAYLPGSLDSWDCLPGSLEAFEIVDMVGLLELLLRAEFVITHVGLLSPTCTTEKQGQYVAGMFYPAKAFHSNVLRFKFDQRQLSQGKQVQKATLLQWTPQLN